MPRSASSERDRAHRVLLVCSGNICRSPMAAWMVRQRAAARGMPVEVASAGTLGIVDAPADARVIGVCEEAGIAVQAHRSQGVSVELLAWADSVLVMELAHALHIRTLVADLPEDKVQMLGSYGGMGDIEDPIGAWFKGPYREARDQIGRCVDGWLTWLGAA